MQTALQSSSHDYWPPGQILQCAHHMSTCLNHESDQMHMTSLPFVCSSAHCTCTGHDVITYPCLLAAQHSSSPCRQVWRGKHASPAQSSSSQCVSCLVLPYPTARRDSLLRIPPVQKPCKNRAGADHEAPGQGMTSAQWHVFQKPFQKQPHQRILAAKHTALCPSLVAAACMSHANGGRFGGPPPCGDQGVFWGAPPPEILKAAGLIGPSVWRGAPPCWPAGWARCT